MNTLVVYDSQFGNTEQVARAIAATLETVGDVRVVSAAESRGADLAGIDLLLVGGPTQGHGVRQQMRAWLDAAPSDALRGMALATFDTRLHWPMFMSGSAARTIAKTLAAKGARLVAAPGSFLVAGSKGPMRRGEIERAGSWAASIAAQLSTTAKRPR